MKNKGVANIGLIIIALIIGMAMMQQQQGFQLLPMQTYIQPQYPLQPTQQAEEYWVQININPNDVCKGDSVTGTITSNIPMGGCTIFFDSGTGYQVFNNVQLNPSGGYSYSDRPMTAGSANFVTTCCDQAGKCKTSNEATLVVRDCATTTTPTTTPILGYRCCQSKFFTYYCSQKCNSGDKEVGIYDTLKRCQLYCKSGITTTTKTTTTTATTTVSGTVYCTASWPMPKSQKDCTYRIGCQKYEACVYEYDLKLGSRCVCKSKLTTTVQTTTVKTTTPTTTPITCDSLCPSNYHVKSTYSGTLDQCCRDIGSWCYGYQYNCELKTSGSLTCCCGWCDYSKPLTTSTTIPPCSSICASQGFNHYKYLSSPEACNDECWAYCGGVGNGCDWNMVTSEGCCCWRCNNPI